MSGNQTFKIQIEAVDKATKVVAEINAKVNGIAKNTNRFKPLFDPDRLAGAGWSKIGREIEAPFKRIAGIDPLGMLAGSATIAALTMATARWATLGSQVARTSQTIGVSAEGLQKYESAAKLAGLAPGVMTSALGNLGQTLNDARWGRNKPALDLMNQLNMQMKYTKDGVIDTTAMYDELTRKISSTGLAPQTKQTITSIFGVQETLPLMAKGEAALSSYLVQAEKANSVMFPNMVTQAVRTQNAVDYLSESFKGLSNEVLFHTGPALERGATGLSAMVHKYKDAAAGLASVHVGFLSYPFSKMGPPEDTQIPGGWPLATWLLKKGGLLKAGPASTGPVQSPPIAAAAWISRSQSMKAQLMGYGWTPAQAAGIIANIKAESGGDPSRIGDGGQAYGLAQWHADRQANFAKWAGHDIKGSSQSEQIAFINWELNNTEKAAGDRLRRSTDPAVAGYIGSRYWERPSDDYDEKASSRAAYATSLYNSWTSEEMSYLKPPVGQDSRSQSSGDTNSKIEVEVVLKGIPEGAQANVNTKGLARSNLRVEKSMKGGL